jgi:hypothetical protein
MQPAVLRVIAEGHENEWHDGKRCTGDDEGRRTPADGLGEEGDGRQEDQLAGGAPGGQDAHDEPAPPDEPAVGHGGREHERHRPGAEADQ